MANRVKTISKYSGSAWGTEVPIGADATNVDMTTAPSDYDSSTSETSKTLIGTNDVKVIASDTDLTAWGKFNRFRRRVSNKFADYFATANVKTSYQTTGANDDVYSTSLLNSYFSNVIGYTGSSVPTAGSVASQLESLNSKLQDIVPLKLSTTAYSSSLYVIANNSYIFNQHLIIIYAYIRWDGGGNGYPLGDFCIINSIYAPQTQIRIPIIIDWWGDTRFKGNFYATLSPNGVFNQNGGSLWSCIICGSYLI